MSWFKKARKEGAPPTAERDGADAPWILAERLHDDRFLRLAAQVANWRLFAFISLALAFLAIGGLVYIGTKSKFVPMLVEVDKLGQTVVVRALTGTDAVTDASRSVYREMFDLIENLRSVTTDRAANNERVARGFSRLTGSAYSYVRTELKKNPPNEVGSTKTVQVQVKTALRLAGKSWQVDWEEHSMNLAGEVMGVEKWRATVQYDLLPAGDEPSIRRNPIGFTVSELSWQKVI